MVMVCCNPRLIFCGDSVWGLGLGVIDGEPVVAPFGLDGVKNDACGIIERLGRVTIGINGRSIEAL